MKEMLFTYILLHALLSCSPKAGEQASVKDSTPVCILKRIEEIRKEPVWSPAAEINEYSYNGQTVYLVTANCCDQYITLMNKRCEVLCAPSGGFTGRGDGNCPDFMKRPNSCGWCGRMSGDNKKRYRLSDTLLIPI